MTHLDSKARFSNRVDDYVKYRPDYPRQILTLLHDRIGFSPSWKVADVGSGTGIASRMFLENGNEVFSVEPNAQMRAAAEEFLSDQPRFHSINASAEATTLANASVDLVICAQAFHWFDKPATAREFKRILQPRGYVAVIWNIRLAQVDQFAIEYDALLTRWGTDYGHVAHRTPMSVDEFATIFGVPFERLTLPNEQSFTLEGLKGRVRSSSYTPTPGQPGHDELFAGVKELFDRHQQNGQVRFAYETEIFLGRLGNP
ncbi:MAG TPA: class I SAM-dependent methyltransferase [Tepidisphaeraceae bacterium]|jgi:SAM-dependent methyltransferase|nr:class I SAM-dependent methyltransferase [Tepidisphaeraceae bacterium]